MARSNYGMSPGDVVLQPTPSTTDDSTAVGVDSGVVFQIWSFDRSTQLTDLTTADPNNPTAAGTPITQVTADSLGRIPFKGPDPYTADVWAFEPISSTWWGLRALTGGGASGSITLNGHSVSLGGSLTLSPDDFSDGTTNHVFTAADDTKLGGIATNATANSSDATLLNRVNGTGILPASGVASGGVLYVYSDASGHWPLTYDATTGDPATYSTAQNVGTRPSGRTKITVGWVDTIGSGVFPPSVSSGSGGVLQGRDFKLKIV